MLVAQLFLVARLGTDIPINDQWDAEGRLLYPAWGDGTLRWTDLARAHNEHRILWTQLINLAVFQANGQWDPLVQLMVNAAIHALTAAVLAGMLAREFGMIGQGIVVIGVVIAQLPHVAWGNSLWGFQSQVYLVILCSIISLALLADPRAAMHRRLGGYLVAFAGLFAMGAGAIVPVVLLGMATVRAWERRSVDQRFWREIWPAGILLIAAFALRVDVTAHAVLRARTVIEFLTAFGRAAGWPHTWIPATAIMLNLPLLLAVVLRLMRRRTAASGEDFVLLLGGWVLVTGAAMAWKRGGGPDFEGGVGPRYTDFLVLLPIANTWCGVQLAREFGKRRRHFVQFTLAAWLAFLAIGWYGRSSQVMRGLIIPWMGDPEKPVRLAVAFQQSGRPAVYGGQPVLFVPHPNLETVWTVLQDPRMEGRLPPSFQPERRMGPLSRAARWLLGRDH
ncbi:MAG: hypothetical protein ABIS43_21335 [Opitutus sp.]